MKRFVGMALVAVLLLVLAAPARAIYEFYPGDAPPSANPAGHHDDTSPSCDTNRVCEEGPHPAQDSGAFTVGAQK